jgi:hypothetical protein
VPAHTGERQRERTRAAAFGIHMMRVNIARVGSTKSCNTSPVIVMKISKGDDDKIQVTSLALYMKLYLSFFLFLVLSLVFLLRGSEFPRKQAKHYSIKIITFLFVIIGKK